MNNHFFLLKLKININFFKKLIKAIVSDFGKISLINISFVLNY